MPTRLVLPFLASLILLVSCDREHYPSVAESTGVGTVIKPEPADAPRAPIYVRMTTTAGDITLELDQQHAPITVQNFLAHVYARDYDGTIFHRVIPDFVIQGGGWTPDLVEKEKIAAAKGKPDPKIRNEWQNGLKNTRGTIAMARDEAPDTATREFYINVVDNPKLDSPREKTGNAGYAVFGRVVSGWDTIEKIRTARTGPRPDVHVDDSSMENVPLEPVEIRWVNLVY